MQKIDVQKIDVQKNPSPLNFSEKPPIFFCDSQLKVMDEAVLIAEELVSNYYKMSSAQWLRSRYEIKTLKDLNADEIVDGPFAQVLGYQVRTTKNFPGSRVIDYYKVCFQDQAILTLPALNVSNLTLPALNVSNLTLPALNGSENTCANGQDCKEYLSFLPFLIYITVHELVHIVRFATFKQIYSVASEVDCAMEEERKVHKICWNILKKTPIAGMDNVLLFHAKWRAKNGNR